MIHIGGNHEEDYEKLENIFAIVAFAEANEFGDWKEMDKHKTQSLGKSLKSLKKNNKCKGGDIYATSK